MHTIETQLEFDFMKPEQLELKIDTGDTIYLTSNLLVNNSLYVPPAYSVIFHKDNEVVGKLTWKDGPMKFDGDAEESAQLFFDNIIKQYTQIQLEFGNQSGWKS